MEVGASAVLELSLFDLEVLDLNVFGASAQLVEAGTKLNIQRFMYTLARKRTRKCLEEWTSYSTVKIGMDLS